MEPSSLYESHHYQKTSAHQDPLFASMGKEKIDLASEAAKRKTSPTVSGEHARNKKKL
ncbi:hypothetical protein QG37_00091 [Candidozyma auris]|nr:hypothetical protein QG37_00091 [[Candida] auris]